MSTGSARLTHAYAYTTDLAATRAFYEGILGLTVTVHNDSFVEFAVGVRLVFLLGAKSLAEAAGFSSFPGWHAPHTHSTAALCSIQVDKPALDSIRDTLLAARAPFTEIELRDGAWELRVLDPMGYTVELYALDFTG